MTSLSILIRPLPSSWRRAGLSAAVLFLSAATIGSVASPADAEAHPFFGPHYVLGELSGPLGSWIAEAVEGSPFSKAPSVSAAEIEDTRPIVVGGAGTTDLDGATAKRLVEAFAAGWPIAVVGATVEGINRVHRTAETGQVFKVAPGGAPPEALAFWRRLDGGYSQIRILAGGDAEAAAGNVGDRATALLAWLAEGRRRTLQATVESSPAADNSTSTDELTEMISAWNDTQSFYLNDGTTGGQSLFQCYVQVWQAYQVSSATDFYYLEQNCNFSPQNTFAVRAKTLDVSLPLSIVGASEDWDQVSWYGSSIGSTECPGNSSGSGRAYTACDYYNYATGYNVNLQPQTPDGGAESDPSVVTLVKESPPTTTGNTTITQGMTYSISGQVVAGTAGSSVSANAGVSIQNSTSTTVPDVTISNNSLTSSTNAQWGYGMAAVGVNHDGCDNSTYAPTTVQTTTYNPRQDMIWSAQSSYRSLDGFSSTFDVGLEFTFTGFESTMYVDEKGTRNVSDLSSCNAFACSCKIVTAGPWTHSSGVQLLSIPVPSTDYDPTTAE